MELFQTDLMESKRGFVKFHKGTCSKGEIRDTLIQKKFHPSRVQKKMNRKHFINTTNLEERSKKEGLARELSSEEPRELSSEELESITAGLGVFDDIQRAIYAIAQISQKRAKAGRDQAMGLI